ncbi:MAG: glycogen debranching enzyme N-terminal domain-containing protein [Pleurocapsa sp. MO_226.B13]|nr:glycogen debranching enzyme N-terminal domain-containing protein [Pleurocapsa sp. MO_226.B13]
MGIKFGRDICSNLATSESKEWLITNGIGGYGAGTVSGLLTRRYHGLLIAALEPPVGRTLLLSKAMFKNGVFRVTKAAQIKPSFDLA